MSTTDIIIFNIVYSNEIFLEFECPVCNLRGLHKGCLDLLKEVADMSTPEQRAIDATAQLEEDNYLLYKSTFWTSKK